MRRRAAARGFGRRVDARGARPQPPHPHPHALWAGPRAHTGARVDVVGVVKKKTATRRRKQTRLPRPPWMRFKAHPPRARRRSAGGYGRRRGGAAAGRRRCQLPRRGGRAGGALAAAATSTAAITTRPRRPLWRPPDAPSASAVAQGAATRPGRSPRRRRRRPCRQRANAVSPRDRCAPACAESWEGAMAPREHGGARVYRSGGGGRFEGRAGAPRTMHGNWGLGAAIQPGNGNDNRPVIWLTFLSGAPSSRPAPLPSPFWAWVSTSNVSRAVDLSCLQVGVCAQTASNHNVGS